MVVLESGIIALMETVTIDGVEYVKASVLAKKHRYTNDYIGQLCRGKKVDAHLVGRTWYVYPPSLEGHKSTRYSELRSGEKNANSLNEITSSRIAVSAPPKKTPKPHFQDRVFWKPTAYENDSTELHPVPAKGTDKTPLRMPVQLAESERVRVVTASKNVTMVSQPLPAISLSGTLKVQDYSPDFDLPEEPAFSENVDKYSDSDLKPEVLTKPSKPESTTEAEVTTAAGSAFLRRLEVSEKSPTLRPSQPHAVLSDIKPVETMAVKGAEEPRSAPLRVSKSVVVAEDPRSSLFFRLVIAPAVTLLLLGVAATLLALENVTVAGGGEQVASLRFDATVLTSFFAE